MNPRIKKIGRNILFLLSVPGIVGAFVFANTNRHDERLSGIHIDIENTELSFVTTENILDLLAEEGVKVHQSILTNMQVNELETTIRGNRWVNDAEIYVTADHALNVKVTQKLPVVRINQNDSIDYAFYLDARANPIALSEQYIAQVPVVTTARLGYSEKDMSIKRDLVQVAMYLHADSFWNCMITQINYDSRHQIELIPALGNQVILLGSAEDLDGKMKRLLAFYQHGITNIDWNRYDEIDLRYSRQVVARNTKVKELINKTIEKAKIEEAKKHREKYLQSLAAKGKTVPKVKATKTNKPEAKAKTNKPSKNSIQH